MHEFEFKSDHYSDRLTLVLARLGRVNAVASKPTHKAGRRGGDSTARWSVYLIYCFSRERAALSRFFGCGNLPGRVRSVGAQNARESVRKGA